MHGNVSEWTLDAYSENGYPVKAGELIENPWKKPNKLYPRVVRGGAWTDSPRELQSTARKGSNNGKKGTPKFQKVSGGILTHLFWVLGLYVLTRHLTKKYSKLTGICRKSNQSKSLI